MTVQPVEIEAGSLASGPIHGERLAYRLGPDAAGDLRVRWTPADATDAVLRITVAREQWDIARLELTTTDGVVAASAPVDHSDAFEHVDIALAASVVAAVGARGGRLRVADGHEPLVIFGQNTPWSPRLVTAPERLTVEVLAERGATITSIVDRASGTELLWTPRWGLPHRDGVDLPGSSEAVAMGRFPGGWCTLFPNAGAPSHEHGVEWPMHGEVWMTAFDVLELEAGLECDAVLVRSPFGVTRRIELADNRVTVTETATNLGREPVEAVWNQHPAFGQPLIGEHTRITTNAARSRPDIADPRALPEGTPWPHHVPPGGDRENLSRLPPPGSGLSRRAFLAEFGEDAWVRIANPECGLAATLTWSSDEFPFAWYWLEAGGRSGFPWFGEAYVLAVEPCTSYPTGGLAEIRRLSGTQIALAPGHAQTRSVTVSVDRVLPPGEMVRGPCASDNAPGAEGSLGS